MFRENRVPHYQRLFQNHDGKRQWWKVSHDRTASPQLFNGGNLTANSSNRPPVPATSCTPTCLASTVSVLVSGTHLEIEDPMTRELICTFLATTYAMFRMVFVSLSLPSLLATERKLLDSSQLVISRTYTDFFNRATRPGSKRLPSKGLASEVAVRG